MIKFDINNKISEKYLVRKYDVFKILDNYDMTGWIDVSSFDKSIYDIREKIKDHSSVLVVIGIGGSYLGSKAIFDMFSGYFSSKFEIIYAGTTMSEEYLKDLVGYLSDKDFSINVISKSGNTLETKTAYNYLINYMKTRYSDYSDRVIITTGESGYLFDEVKKNNYTLLNIPDNIGGRYSMMTSAHLFPLSFVIDIEKFLLGYNSYNDIELSYNYAAFRRTMFDNNKVVENYVSFEEKLSMFLEWIKQLFGESEGKGSYGILPTSTIFTRDLHSLGQFIQEGTKTEFETILYIDEMEKDIVFPSDHKNLDNMNYLSGKNLSWVNEMAFKGTLSAHSEEGNNPNIVIHLKNNSAYSFGYMIYFFFIACGMSCYLLGINPFNQPGVEVYKKKMFALLGKPE